MSKKKGHKKVIDKKTAALISSGVAISLALFKINTPLKGPIAAIPTAMHTLRNAKKK